MESDTLYGPLEAHQFRVLILHPAADRDDRLVCDLEHASFDPSPSVAYETISYCWGDATVRNEVEIEGRPFSVPASSALALRRVRLRDRSCTLWIDAICINQQDDNEKSTQVAMMAEIYRKGVRNLVYLGEETEASVNVKEALDYVHEEFGCLGEEAMASHNLDAIPQGHVVAIRDLYMRDWFSRAWVIQEAALPTESLVLVGSTTLSLLKVMCIARSMLDKYIIHASDLGLTLKLHSIHVRSSYGVPPLSPETLPWLMESILELSTWKKALDPRDAIYSILGLIPWPEGAIPALLSPDYSKTARNVHRDAARYLLQCSSLGLRTLQYTSYDNTPAVSITDYPSWVPRWDRGILLHDNSQRNHSAHGGTAMDVLAFDPEDPDVLELRGILIDTVAECGESFSNADFEVNNSSARVLKLGSKVVELSALELNAADGWWQLATFLTAGSGEWTKDQAVARIKAYAAHIHIQEQREQPAMPFQLPTDASQVDRDASDFLEMLRLTWRKRKLFQTTAGRLGICRATVEPGDEVAILYGSREPHILRPCNGLYYYLGRAYVRGIMAGEAVRQHEVEGKESRMFRLR